MMRRGDRDDPPTGRTCRDLEPFVEMIHEGRDAGRGRGQVASDGDFLIPLLPHVTGNDWFLRSVWVFYNTEFVGHFVIESLVHPSEKFDRCRPGQRASPVHFVYGTLDDDMRARFQGERAGFFFELGAGEGTFDISRPCVVPLDQV